jgi:predicted metal-dependent peptidase
MNLTAEEKIIQARVWLISRFPFWGSLTMHLTFVENNNMPMHTMAVSPYGTVYFDRNFVDGLCKEEVMFVICHEVLHVILIHLDRLGTRNEFKWNMACDYAVNNLIKNEPQFKAPPNILINTKFDNMSSEAIYDALPPPEECDGDCAKCPICKGKAQFSPYGDKQCKKFGSFDKHITKNELEGGGNGDKDDKGEVNEGEVDANGIPKDAYNEKPENAPNWRKITNEAYHYARMQGKLPAGMERVVEDIVEPQLSWKELLSQFITKSIPFNYTYRRMSRKSICSGIYFPGVEKEEIKVTVVIDTSGSIGQDELTDFMSEAIGILKQFDRVEMEIFSCDAQLSKASIITNEYDLITTRLQGGGGTDYRPIFHRISKKQMDTKVLIYFGDMEATFPEENEVPIGLNTIWVVCKGGNEDNVPKFFPYVVKLK